MHTISESRQALEHSAAVPAGLLQELARALDHESGIVCELRDALIQQRAGVASSEAAAVNASVDAIGRILLTLEEARSHRTGIVAALAGDPRLGLDRLEAALGAPLSARVEEARAGLCRAAGEVAHEVAINRAVLRRAVEAGEAFLQALFSATADPPAVYGSPQRREESGAAVFLNRKA
jgi:capsid protein